MNKFILENDFLQIEYSTSSLRITGLFLKGKPNLLADLGNFPPIPTPYGDFHFQGGHRLWHSPEAMPRTYIPDTGGLTITDLRNGVVLEAQSEPGTGISKRIEIRLVADQPSATLTHTLTNHGLWPVELAPWAITQFRLGGIVVLPMPVGNSDPAGLLHNRQFSLWPYAHITDPRLKLDDRFILFKAEAILPPFKIGYFNSPGWLAYWLDGVLFRKTFDVHVGLPHPEMYCDNQFVELESLAPLKTLNPGASVHHVETWDMYYELDSLSEDMQKAIMASS
jgi:hypothetical protein